MSETQRQSLFPGELFVPGQSHSTPPFLLPRWLRGLRQPAGTMHGQWPAAAWSSPSPCSSSLNRSQLSPLLPKHWPWLPFPRSYLECLLLTDPPETASASRSYACCSPRPCANHSTAPLPSLSCPPRHPRFHRCGSCRWLRQEHPTPSHRSPGFAGIARKPSTSSDPCWEMKRHQGQLLVR